MKIDFDDRGAIPVSKTICVTIKQAVLATLRNSFEEDISRLNYEVSISFVADEEMRGLNLQYREKDAPTDVLSFPSMNEPAMEEPAEEGDCRESVAQAMGGGKSPTRRAAPARRHEVFHMGDIVISTETAARQAQEYGHSLERELAFLAVHGILHLLGLDHEVSEEDERVMNEIQDEVLRKLNI